MTTKHFSVISNRSCQALNSTPNQQHIQTFKSFIFLSGLKQTSFLPLTLSVSISQTTSSSETVSPTAKNRWNWVNMKETHQTCSKLKSRWCLTLLPPHISLCDRLGKRWRFYRDHFIPWNSITIHFTLYADSTMASHVVFCNFEKQKYF